MFSLILIHAPHVSWDRYGLISQTARRNAHRSYNSNTTLRPVLGVLTHHQQPPCQR